MAIDEEWVKGKGGRSAIIFSVVILVLALGVAISAAISGTTLMVAAMSLQVIASAFLMAALLRARRAAPRTETKAHDAL